MQGCKVKPYGSGAWLRHDCDMGHESRRNAGFSCSSQTINLRVVAMGRDGRRSAHALASRGRCGVLWKVPSPRPSSSSPRRSSRSGPPLSATRALELGQVALETDRLRPNRSVEPGESVPQVDQRGARLHVLRSITELVDHDPDRGSPALEQLVELRDHGGGLVDRVADPADRVGARRVAVDGHGDRGALGGPATLRSPHGELLAAVAAVVAAGGVLSPGFYHIVDILMTSSPDFANLIGGLRRAMERNRGVSDG